MADIKLSVSVAMVAAVILGEILSAIWYSDATPWGHRYTGARYWVAALASDIGLVFLLKYIMEHYWSVYDIESAAWLALWLGLGYACLEAPHVVHNHRSFTYFLFHALHKVALVFVMAFSLFHFKKYE